MQRVKKVVSAALAALVVLALSGCWTPGATSGSQAQGINYSFRSLILVDMNDPQGWTHKGTVEVWTNNGAAVPPGWMGAQVRIYNSSGALCGNGNGNDEYTSTWQSHWSTSLWTGGCSGSNWFTRGRAFIYSGASGDPYHRFNTYASPYDN